MLCRHADNHDAFQLLARGNQLGFVLPRPNSRTRKAHDGGGTKRRRLHGSRSCDQRRLKSVGLSGHGFRPALPRAYFPSTSSLPASRSASGPRYFRGIEISSRPVMLKSRSSTSPPGWCESVARSSALLATLHGLRDGAWGREPTFQLEEHKAALSQIPASRW